MYILHPNKKKHSANSIRAQMKQPDTGQDMLPDAPSIPIGAVYTEGCLHAFLLLDRADKAYQGVEAVWLGGA